MKALLNLVFPPLCVHCGMETPLRYLCETCWNESEVVNPQERCEHCFQECEEGRCCAKCLRKPVIPFTRAAAFDRRAPFTRLIDEEKAHALAGFAYYQWLRLNWLEPDLIAAIPPHKNTIARAFAEIAEKPCPHLFKRIAWPLRAQRWKLQNHLVEEGSTVLLFDEGCTPKQLKMAIAALSGAFPKKIYILSLSL